MRQARKRAVDVHEVDKVYVQLRMKQLRERADETLQEALDQFDRDLVSWKVSLMSKPGEHGSAWDDLTHRIRTQDGFREYEEKP